MDCRLRGYIHAMHAMITVFSELQSLEKPLDIALGNGRTLEATGRGTEISDAGVWFPEE